ncbi:MAG: hypothetical protein P8Y37_11750 [Anaerolineales bacterium]
MQSLDDLKKWMHLKPAYEDFPVLPQARDFQGWFAASRDLHNRPPNTITRAFACLTLQHRQNC